MTANQPAPDRDELAGAIQRLDGLRDIARRIEDAPTPGSADLTEAERAAVERGEALPQRTIADLYPDGIDQPLARRLAGALGLHEVIERRVSREVRAPGAA